MKNKSSILFAVLVWSLLIVRFGYRFGSDDQIELLPYTLFLHNPSLYPNDLFIHGLHAAVPNERTIAAYLLLPFINHLEIVCFILHFISTILLLFGLENLASRFIKNRLFVWLCIITTLIPFANVTLGSVVSYSEMFQSSFLGAALALWGIIFFLDKRYVQSSSVLVIATFLHLLEGLDVMIVLATILLIRTFLQKTETVKVFLTFILLYFFTAGIYLVMNWMSKQMPVNTELREEYFRILFQFRLPHHYIITSFPKLKMILFFLLSGIAVLFFRKKSETLFYFSVMGVVGMLLYAFLTIEFQNIIIASFQFFKLAQWIKYLGLVAVFAWAENFLNQKTSTLLASFRTIVLFTSVCLVTEGFLFLHPSFLPQENVYQIGKWKETYSDIQICSAIKQTVSANALFVQPLMCTELKYYSQRSSYIDFKAAPRNVAGLKSWYYRLNEIYGIDASGREQGFDVRQNADSFYYHLSTETLLKLKTEGVTHLLTLKQFPCAAGTLILSNNTYAVYQL